MTSEPSKRPNRQAPLRHLGTDGLRVIALVAVLLFHLFPEQVKGGFLGVVIFFVIAGYYGARGQVMQEKAPIFKGILNRFLKLWGPLLFLLTFVALLTAYLLPDVFVHVRQDAPSALFGYNNIAQILQDRSYFQRHGSFNPLTHLWALSLEMQFYLFFPFLYKGINTLFKKAKTKAFKMHGMGIFFSILALLSILVMALSYVPKADPTVVYYGSLSRIFAFFIGAAGYLFQVGCAQQRKRPLTKSTRTVLAWTCLLLLLAPIPFVSFESSLLFRGGMALYALICLFFIQLAGLFPVQGMAFLHARPLRFLSKRSYGLYLWQYALMVLEEAFLRFSTLGTLPRLAIHFLSLALFTELSYRLFEQKGLIRPILRKALSGLLFVLLLAIWLLPAPVAPSAPALDAAVVEAKIQERQGEQRLLLASLAEAKQQRAATFAKRRRLQEAEDDAAIKEEEERSKEVPQGSANPFGYTREQMDALAQSKVIMVGDSVLAMTTQQIRTYIPTVYVDAQVSRQFAAAPEILSSIPAAMKEGARYVIALGTNGDIPDATLTAIRQMTEGAPLYFVNLVVPGNWERANNQKLEAFCAQTEGCTLIDWYQTAKEHPEYFYQDATHPIPAGAAVYDRMVLDALLKP